MPILRKEKRPGERQGAARVVNHGIPPYPKARDRLARNPRSPVFQDWRCSAAVRRGAVRSSLLGVAVPPTQAQQERHRATPLPASRGGNGPGDQAIGARGGLHDFGGTPGAGRGSSASRYAGSGGQEGSRAKFRRYRKTTGSGCRRGTDPGRTARDRLPFVGAPTKTAAAARAAGGVVARIGESVSTVGWWSEFRLVIETPDADPSNAFGAMAATSLRRKLLCDLKTAADPSLRSGMTNLWLSLMCFRGLATSRETQDGSLVADSQFRTLD